MFENYIRNEEAVTAYQFDGSGESMTDLVDHDPDSFELRYDEYGEAHLIIKTEKEYIRVYDGDYVVQDSCGHYYTYEPEFFEFVFRKDADNLDLEAFSRDIHESARALVEKGLSAAQSEGKSFPFKEWDELSDKVREGIRLQALYLLGSYSIVRR